MPILTLQREATASTRDPGNQREEVVLSAMDRRIEPRRVTVPRIASGLGALLVVGLATYAYFQFPIGRTLAVDAAERLRVSTVAYGTFREYIPVTGNVVPRTTVYLDAVDGGQITAVDVEAGAFVTAGQPLVTFKNLNLELQVISAEAQLTEQLDRLSSTQLAFDQGHLRNRRELIEIDYQIDRLHRELERNKPLVATGGVAASHIEDLDAELQRFQALHEPAQHALALDDDFRANQIERMAAALEAMNKNLDIARANLSNLVVVAPITGQLTTLDAHVGESKRAGQRVGQIDEVGAVKVSAFVDEFYVSRVMIGQAASVDVDETTYDLTVSKVYPDVRDREFQIDLSFVGKAPELRRGQTLRVRLEIGQPANTLVLANGPFFDDTGGQWVFVVDPSRDFAERRTVRFGRRNPEGIEVLEGLRDGERVITSSYERFASFDRIEFRSES